jgi:hypothetical protein
MKKDEPVNEDAFDISIFEIPPAAAYFETIQQLQKVSAKLDVLLQGQCEIKAALKETSPASEVEQVRRAVAQRYEELLLRYFEGTDLNQEALKGTIHEDDRVYDSRDPGFRRPPIVG